MNKPARTETGQEGLSFASALQDLLVCGVSLVDAHKKVVTLTDEARQILGLGSAPALPAGLEILPAPLRKIVREVLSSGAPIADRHIEIKVEGRGAVNLRISALPGQPGNAESGVVLAINDLTPLKRLEQRLWQIDRLAAIGTLSASAAHEIKNALVAGKTFVDLLLEQHKGSELVEVVRRELGRIDDIATRMLKFGAPGRAKLSEVRLHEVLEHSLRLVQPQLNNKSISLSRSFQAAPDRVHGDDGQLQQAFVNLLLNALEATGPNGTLAVTTDVVSSGAASAPPTQLRIMIQDSGTGIAPEHLGRLFEPFFTTKPTGTGLGLPITRQIIREHRGEIHVTSEPGKGTAFHILLPPSPTAA